LKLQFHDFHCSENHTTTESSSSTDDDTDDNNNINSSVPTRNGTKPLGLGSFLHAITPPRYKAQDMLDDQRDTTTLNASRSCSSSNNRTTFRNDYERSNRSLARHEEDPIVANNDDSIPFYGTSSVKVEKETFLVLSYPVVHKQQQQQQEEEEETEHDDDDHDMDETRSKSCATIYRAYRNSLSTTVLIKRNK
jgi:hypothetical protein